VTQRRRCAKSGRWGRSPGTRGSTPRPRRVVKEAPE